MRQRISRDTHLSAPQPKGTSRLAALAFEQFSAGLFRFLRRRLHSAESAEDLAQEVYLRLLRTADTGHVRCPQAYLYRIAFNVLYEFRLRERGGALIFDSNAMERAAEQLPDDAPTPDEAYERGALAQRYERAFAQLPPMQRAVLRLAIHHDLSHAEIAKSLAISVSTMRNHLYKAVDSCRHRIGEQ